MSTFSYPVIDQTCTLGTIRMVSAEGCPMPDTYLNGRPVYFGDLVCAHCDSYFLSASYADDDTDLNDDELDRLTEQEADYIVQENCERYGYWED